MSLARTAKEVARHLLHSAGYRRKLSHLTGDREASFAAIYEQGVWAHGEADVPLSGHGSSVAATTVLRDELGRMLESIGTRTLLDLGCGDFTWMQHADLHCKYIGLDIVPSVIERNRAKYGSESREFLVGDFVNQVPPRADTVICREVLFHLSFADALSGLRNALAMGCSHFILTSDSGTGFNADIVSGDFRRLNLQKRPFNFPPPSAKIDDSAVSAGRCMGLWQADAVRQAVT